MSKPWKSVIASTFADPADIRAFRRAKARGLTDQQAFAYGDNGIGKWGDDTTKPEPMVALPPDDWKFLGEAARGRPVFVRRNGITIRAELRDTMPWKRNIRNGAGIDLNPAAAEMLGISIPGKARVEWKWAEEVPAPPPDFKPGGLGFRDLLRLLASMIKSPFR